MPKNTRTHIYCYDDHRGFAEDVRKRFSDTSRYSIFSFQTREEYISHLQAEREHNYCKIAILGLHEPKEQFEMIEQLTMETKRIDHRTGLILLGPPDKIEEIKKTVRFNIDAYIPKNTNSILRIHNTVKKLISEYNIGIFRRRRNFSVWLLIICVILSALFLLLAYLRLPQYF